MGKIAKRSSQTPMQFKPTEVAEKKDSHIQALGVTEVTGQMIAFELAAKEA